MLASLPFASCSAIFLASSCSVTTCPVDETMSPFALLPYDRSVKCEDERKQSASHICTGGFKPTPQLSSFHNFLRLLPVLFPPVRAGACDHAATSKPAVAEIPWSRQNAIYTRFNSLPCRPMVCFRQVNGRCWRPDDPGDGSSRDDNRRHKHDGHTCTARKRGAATSGGLLLAVLPTGGCGVRRT